MIKTGLSSLTDALVPMGSVAAIGAATGVPAGSITVTELANNAVETAKIKVNNVTATRLTKVPTDLGAAHVTVDFSNSNGAFDTSIVTDGSVTATGGFVGALTGNADTATNAGNADTVTNGVYTTDTGTVTNAMLAADVEFINKAGYVRYFDDFCEGAQALATAHAGNYWTGGGTSGTVAVIAEENGILQLDTGASGSQSASIIFTNANFDKDQNPIFEARIKTDALTHRKIFIGWEVDGAGNDYLGYAFDTAVDAANIYLVSDNDNAGEVATDTTVDLTAGDYFVLRLEIKDDLSFVAKINGTAVAGTHLGTIRDVAFKPYFIIDNKSEAQSNKLDVDYVEVYQDRV